MADLTGIFPLNFLSADLRCKQIDPRSRILAFIWKVVERSMSSVSSLWIQGFFHVCFQGPKMGLICWISILGKVFIG